MLFEIVNPVQVQSFFKFLSLWVILVILLVIGGYIYLSLYCFHTLTPQSSDDYQGDLFYLSWWSFYPFWCGTTFVSTLVICCLLTDWFIKVGYIKRKWQHSCALEKALYFFLKEKEPCYGKALDSFHTKQKHLESVSSVPAVVFCF